MRARKHEEIAHTLDETSDNSAAIEAAMDDDLGDELLGLIFTACHPMLPPDARAALTLRVVGGLTTDEIARAFLSNEATIAQRIVRAKRRLRKPDCGSRCRAAPNARRGCPRCSRSSISSSTKAMPPRRATILSGRVSPRKRKRLGRILAGLMPGDAEVFAFWP